MMKKTLLAVSALAFFAIASTAFAQGFVPLAPITGLTDPGTATSIINQNSFANFFNNLYKFVIGLAAALAVIMIIWGGLEISTQDSVSKQSKGREHITQAIYGLILVLAPVLVFSIINPSILNLSIGITPLGIVTGATAIPTVVLPTCSLNQTTGCIQPQCNSVRTTNCIGGVNAVAVGLYSAAQSGGYCYQITNCTSGSCTTECGAGGCNYQCGNESQCTSNLNQEVRGTTVPASASCALYP